MIKLPGTHAFDEYTPIQVHPAPAANYWGEGQSNCHVITVGSAEPVVWEANPGATLILVETTADVRMLIDGEETVAEDGLPIYAGKERSFGIPAGASVAFVAVSDEATVSILEA